MAITSLKLCMACTLVLLLSHSSQATQRADNYSEILIFGEGEDTTSWFDTIFLFKPAGTLTRIITIWNGGCCQAPLIEEFQRGQNKFEHVKSYNVDEKPKDFPKYILCTPSVRETRVEPTHDAKRGMSAKDYEFYLKEAEPFKGG